MSVTCEMESEQYLIPYWVYAVDSKFDFVNQETLRFLSEDIISLLSNVFSLWNYLAPLFFESGGCNSLNLLKTSNFTFKVKTFYVFCLFYLSFHCNF